MREHRIIYDMLDDVTQRLIARLPPVSEVEELSSAAVLQVFEMKGKGTIAGCAVEGGTFVSDQLVQVLLDVSGCLPCVCWRRLASTGQGFAQGQACACSASNAARAHSPA